MVSDSEENNNGLSTPASFPWRIEFYYKDRLIAVHQCKRQGQYRFGNGYRESLSPRKRRCNQCDERLPDEIFTQVKLLLPPIRED